MFDSREIAERALCRAEFIRAKRKRRRKRLTTTALLCSLCALAVCFVFLPGGYGGTGPPPAQASVTILDGAMVGGYVLTGVIGFTLGVVVAVICKRRQEKRKREKENLIIRRMKNNEW